MAVPRPGLGAQLCQRRHHSIPVQFGYRTTLQDDPYPRAFSVGGFYVTGSYADPLLNADGQNRVLFGGEPKMDYGSSQVYIQAQQMVYPPDASDRGLTVFGGANWTTSGQPNVEGCLRRHLLQRSVCPATQRHARRRGEPCRRDPRVTERVNSILSKSTGGQASQSEISYEVNYGFAVAPGILIKPFFQFRRTPACRAATSRMQSLSVLCSRWTSPVCSGCQH
jgi:porin